MPSCEDCGQNIFELPHECSLSQWAAHQFLKLQPEVEGLGSEIDTYLATPEGRFEAWYAQHRRKGKRSE